MYAYVARQPIFDRQKRVFAYELLFRDGQSNAFPNIDPDEATSKILAASHLSLGVEEITNGKVAFINFHQDTLLYRFPTSLNPLNVVIEIVETVTITDNLLKACKHIKNLGYRVALDDYDFDPKWDPFLPFVDYIKVEINDSNIETVRAHMPRLKSLGVKSLAEKVETAEQFNAMMELGFDYFQGYFFARPEIIRHRKIDSSRMAMFELIAAIGQQEFDFSKINKIIERDVGLSYMLLRFINNPMVNKRNKITSLRHALNYMGEVEIRKFIALMSLAKLSEGQTPELTHIALVRAHFCELVADRMGELNNPPTGFLVGLFSLLDTMLGQPMNDVTRKLPLADTVIQALCGRENNLHRYLEMAKAYEQADWHVIAIYSESQGIAQIEIDDFYQQSLRWGAEMQRSVA